MLIIHVSKEVSNRKHESMRNCGLTLSWKHLELTVLTCCARLGQWLEAGSLLVGDTWVRDLTMVYENCGSLLSSNRM